MSSPSAFVPTLQFTKLAECASAPLKGSKFSAGYDLASAQKTVVAPKCRVLVKTGIAVAIPIGCYGRVAPRSGLALKHGIDVMAGVIDGDYRGDVGVVLVNLGSEPFEINVGDRIAQLLLEKIEVNASVQEVENLNNLGVTARSGNGFGSTGVSGFKDDGFEEIFG